MDSKRGVENSNIKKKKKRPQLESSVQSSVDVQEKQTVETQDAGRVGQVCLVARIYKRSLTLSVLYCTVLQAIKQHSAKAPLKV